MFGGGSRPGRHFIHPCVEETFCLCFPVVLVLRMHQQYAILFPSGPACFSTVDSVRAPIHEDRARSIASLLRGYPFKKTIVTNKRLNTISQLPRTKELTPDTTEDEQKGHAECHKSRVCMCRAGDFDVCELCGCCWRRSNNTPYLKSPSSSNPAQSITN